MPFDGFEREWEPDPRYPRLWYTISPAGQRKKRRRWQVDILSGDVPGGWWPLLAFYADTKREANGRAAWAVDRFKEAMQ